MIRNQPGKKRRFAHNLATKRYSSVQLREFKDAILGLREAAVNDVKSIKETYATPMTKDDNGVFEHEVGFLERSTHGSSLAENTELIGRQLQLIARLDAALKRIKGGSYGICRICGRPIDRMRLLAVPHTQECMACKTNTAGSPAFRTGAKTARR